MAEWENAPLDPKKKKKQRVNLEPRRPMAARLKKKQRVNLEPRRPMAARLMMVSRFLPNIFYLSFQITPSIQNIRG